MGDVRLSYIDRYTQGMSDIRISRHQLRKNVVVCLNDPEWDIYRDVRIHSEKYRVNKQAIVQKNPDMNYVQDMYDVFLEEDEKLPWTVNLTMSGLLRPLKMDDKIIIDGVVYNVSKVRPNNRELHGLLECLVYPERDSRFIDDPLNLYAVRFRNGIYELELDSVRGKTAVMEIIYGGCPLWMAFTGEEWHQFFVRSRVQVPEDATELMIMDGAHRVAKLKLGELPVEPEELDEEDSEVIYR